MSSHFEMIKKIVKSNPSFKDFLKISVVARVSSSNPPTGLNGAQHDHVDRETFTLEEMFKRNCTCENVFHLTYFIEGSHAFSGESLFKLLKNLPQVQHCDEFKAFNPQRNFDALFVAAKSIASLPPGFDGHHLVVDWLHVNRGYPLNAEAILNLLLSEFKKAANDYLLWDALEVAASAHSYDLAIKERAIIALKEKQQEQLARNTRVLCLIEEYDLTQLLKFARVKEIAAYLLLKSCAPPGSELTALPPYLVTVGVETGWIPPKSSSTRTTLNWVPSPEELLTIELLHANGMELSDAAKAARELT